MRRCRGSVYLLVLLAAGCNNSPAPMEFPTAAPAPPAQEDEEEFITRTLAGQLGKRPDEFSPDETFRDLGADDLDLIELVMALEEKYQIAINDRAIETAAGASNPKEVINGLTVTKLAAVVREAPPSTGTPDSGRRPAEGPAGQSREDAPADAPR